MQNGNLYKISDQEFISRIYREYNRIMYATVRKYNSDYYCCEEIMQECCAKLTAKVEILRELPPTAVASYVVVTARNTAITYLKKKQKYHETIVSISALSENILSYEEPLDQYVLGLV